MLCDAQVPILIAGPTDRTYEGDLPAARTIRFTHLESSHEFTAVLLARSICSAHHGHGERQAIGVPSRPERSRPVSDLSTTRCSIVSHIAARSGSFGVGTQCVESEHSGGESPCASPDFSPGRVRACQSWRKTGPYRQSKRENPVNPGDSRGLAASTTPIDAAGYTASSGKFSSTSFSLLRKNAAIAPSTTL